MRAKDLFRSDQSQAWKKKFRRSLMRTDAVTFDAVGCGEMDQNVDIHNERSSGWVGVGGGGEGDNYQI